MKFCSQGSNSAAVLTVMEKYCSELGEFLLFSAFLRPKHRRLQQNCLCGKVLIWIKGGECVGNIDSRSPSSPLSRAVVEITRVIMLAPPFPGDKGVNGCLLCKESAAVPLC